MILILGIFVKLINDMITLTINYLNLISSISTLWKMHLTRLNIAKCFSFLLHGKIN